MIDVLAVLFSIFFSIFVTVSVIYTINNWDSWASKRMNVKFKKFLDEHRCSGEFDVLIRVYNADHFGRASVRVKDKFISQDSRYDFPWFISDYPTINFNSTDLTKLKIYLDANKYTHDTIIMSEEKKNEL